MKHLSLTILAATMLGLASPAARADFIVEEGPPAHKPAHKPVQKPAHQPAAQPAVAPASIPAQKPASASTIAPAAVPTAPAIAPSAARTASAPGQQGRLVQVGAPMPGPALQGWADEVPLSLALEQVVPSGWTVDAGGVNTAQAVSWKGGRSWHAIVGDLAYGNRFDARIDWVDQTVTLGPVGSMAPSLASASPAAAPPRKEADAPVRKEVDDVAQAPKAAAIVPAVSAPRAVAAVVLPPPPAAPVVMTWTLDPSKTLRENVETWAKRAGWTSVWQGADYPVVAAATFTGEFASAEGPLAKLIAAYDTSDQPLLAKLTTMDRVVTVTNRNYTPTTVAPTAPSEIAPRSFPGTGQ